VKRLLGVLIIFLLALPILALSSLAVDESTLIITANTTSAVVVPGDTATYNITVRSTYLVGIDAFLTASGEPEGWSVVFSESSFTIPANSTYTVTMSVKSSQHGDDDAVISVQAWVDGRNTWSDSQDFTTTTGTLVFTAWENRLKGLYGTQLTAYEVSIADGDSFGVNVWGTPTTVYTPGFEVTDSSEAVWTDWVNFWNIYISDASGTPISGTLTITQATETNGNGFYIALQPLPGVAENHWIRIRGKVTYDSTDVVTATQKYASTTAITGTYGVDLYLAVGETNAKTANAGVTVTYDFHLENIGTISEDIRIWMVGFDTVLPTSWTIVLKDLDTGATLITGDGNIDVTSVYTYTDVASAGIKNLQLQVTPDISITNPDQMRVVVNAQVQLKYHDSLEFGSRQTQEELIFPDWLWWLIGGVGAVIATAIIAVGVVKRRGEEIGD